MKNYIQNTREYLNSKVKEYGNKVGDGLGDLLTAPMNGKILGALTLAAYFGLTACGTAGLNQNAVDSSKYTRQALVHLQQKGVDIDETVKCGDISRRRFIEEDAKYASIDKLLAQKGERLVRSCGDGITTMVLTAQGNVYEVPSIMGLQIGISDWAEVMCAKASAPSRIKRVEGMGPKEFDQMVGKANKKYEERVRKMDRDFEERVREIDRDFEERARGIDRDFKRRASEIDRDFEEAERRINEQFEENEP